MKLNVIPHGNGTAIYLPVAIRNGLNIENGDVMDAELSFGSDGCPILTLTKQK